MSFINRALPEAYFPNYGTSYGAVGSPMTKEPDDLTRYVGPQRVPRLWKPALASMSSLNSRTWPPDASNGNSMAITPHIRPLALLRNTTTTATKGKAILRPATGARVPPITVPTFSGSR